MKRVNAIWNHPRYQQLLKELTDCEAKREFCRHTPEHFLDVARLTSLLAAEEGLEVDREVLYAAALLHDIGRSLQYREGIPHEKAGARIAEELLPACGFTAEESGRVLELILGHRKKKGGSGLAALFARADKLSRNCFLCPAQEACDWPKEKKNLEIRY